MRATETEFTTDVANYDDVVINEGTGYYNQGATLIMLSCIATKL